MKRKVGLLLFLGMGWCGSAFPGNEMECHGKYWIFLRDRPVEQGETVSRDYIRHLESLGIRTVVVSRWLNAVSAFVPEGVMHRVQQLSFVEHVQPVIHYPVERPILCPLEKCATSGSAQIHRLDYGTSLIQNSLIHVPEVHDLGLTGKGIRIGMLDTGFRYQNRSVFSRLNILGEYDFIFNDRNTANQTADPPIEEHHGTETLSVIGGFEEGQLVGPAYEAAFALAKTEWEPTETRIEEDHWVSGMEWLVDSMRVQIVSSSLGYNTFDDGSGYTYTDMNGHTCVTTVEANHAVKKGVTVVCSAGNERASRWHYILSPADGDSVIAVGAVTSGGTLAGFSSVGPTADGRIKPDVVAMGVGVYMANPDQNGTSSFLFANGTSFSCPQAAGVCALILQAHPELTPMQIRDALRNTADRAQNPDTLYGWGLVNATEAIFYHGPVFTNFRNVSLPLENRDLFELDILTKDGSVLDSAAVYYQVPSGAFHRAELLPNRLAGSHTYQGLLSDTHPTSRLRFYVTMTDTSGKRYSGPIGAPDILYTFDKNSNSHLVKVEQIVPGQFRLYPNYPNPFNASTSILFDLAQSMYIELGVLNLRGQSVATLYRGILGPGVKKVVWDGKNETGQLLPSGIYLLILKVGDQTKIRKLTFIR